LAHGSTLPIEIREVEQEIVFHVLDLIRLGVENVRRLPGRSAS